MKKCDFGPFAVQAEALDAEIERQLETVQTILSREPQRGNAQSLKARGKELPSARESLYSGDFTKALRAIPGQPRDPKIGSWSKCYHGRLGFLYNQGGAQ